MEPPPEPPGPAPAGPAGTSTPTTGRVRVAVGLSVCGFTMLAVGGIILLVGHAIRARAPHGWHVIVTLGEIAAACGVGCLLALLIGVLSDRSARGRPGGSPAAGRPLQQDGVDPAPVLASHRGEPPAQREPGPHVQG